MMEALMVYRPCEYAYALEIPKPGRTPRKAQEAYMLTCLYAYMLTCIHAYMLTCSYAYMMGTLATSAHLFDAYMIFYYVSFSICTVQYLLFTWKP